MKNCRRFFSKLIVFSSICIGASTSQAQMPPSSLVEIPSTDAEFASRLTQLASGGGAQGDFFQLKLAEKKLKEGDNKEAMKLAGRVSDSALVIWKNIITAEAYLASQQPREVLVTLAKLPPRPDPELSFGETFYANLYKRALMVRREAKLVLGQDALEESAELAAVFPLDGDVAASLSAEQKMAKLHALHFAYKYSLITGFISPSEITSSHAAAQKKCEALFELGDGLRRNKGMASEAMNAFEAMLSQKCERKLEARALYWIGSLGNEGENDDRAERALTRLVKDFAGHRLHDDALYKLYKRAERMGQTPTMQKYAAELIRLAKGDMRDKLIFETAFPYYEKGEFKRAVAIMEPIIDSEAADETFTQVLYWYARCLQKLGSKHNNQKAMTVYKRIVNEYPFSFYATMAAARADVAIKIAALPQLKGTAPSGDDGFFALIDDLNKDSLHNAASQAMDYAMNLHPEWDKSHKEFIASKYIESHNYRKSLDMAADHFDSGVYGPVTPQSDPMFAAFYPWAFSDAVRGGYKLTGLPRGSIEGIMREESLYQRNVRSYVGATGLMQLMPATAAMVSRGGAGGADAGDLTDPVDNILLGSSYLSQMRDKFDGQMPLAIMAYNAGPGNVNRFLRSLGGMELDEFIENIPINETRGYVKRVMRSMQIYGSLYGDPYFKKPFFTFQVKSRLVFLPLDTNPPDV